MQEDDQTKIKRSLGIIYKSGDLLLHLLTDLLTFSKNQIGQQLSLDEKEFRLSDIRSQILSIFDNQAKEGKISLAVTFQGLSESLETTLSTPEQHIYGPSGTGRVRDMCLWGDQHRILQVIINLVSNSLKFTAPGGSVEVRVRCRGDVKPEPASRHESDQSKHAKLNSSSRSSRRRGRVASGSNSTPASPYSLSTEADQAKLTNTALDLDVIGITKSRQQIAGRERSTSPPPLDARNLLFEFEVEDTGPGIPESQQQLVFKPFVQGDLGLSRKYGGTGLGLSICSQLAGLMGGSINLKSQEGVGSTFTMQIPLRLVKERADSTTSSTVNFATRIDGDPVSGDETQTPKRASSLSDMATKSATGTTNQINGFSTPAKPRLVGLSQPFFATSSPLYSPDQQLAAMEHVAVEASRSGAKVRVLVAEDNPVNQEVVLRMLKLEDIYGKVLHDDIRWLSLIRYHRCHNRKRWPRGSGSSQGEHEAAKTLRLDSYGHSGEPAEDLNPAGPNATIQMPNVDGLQSTRLIRETGYSAPIVALTAFSEENNVKECLDSGMNFFLPKPVSR